MDFKKLLIKVNLLSSTKFIISFPCALEKSFNLINHCFISESDEDEEVYKIYWMTEQKCQKYTRFIRYYVYFDTLGWTGVFAYAVFCIAVGNYNTSSWHLPFFMVLPFDETRVYGWFFEWCIQCSIVFGYCYALTSITAYFVSACFYIVSMCEHFNVIMNCIKSNIKQNQVEIFSWKIRENELKITKQLAKAIKFHNTIFEYDPKNFSYFDNIKGEFIKFLEFQLIIPVHVK